MAQNAAEELGPGVELQQLAQHAVKVNVFHSIDFLLRYSSLKDLMFDTFLRLRFCVSLSLYLCHIAVFE